MVYFAFDTKRFIFTLSLLELVTSAVIVKQDTTRVMTDALKSLKEVNDNKFDGKIKHGTYRSVANRVQGLVFGNEDDGSMIQKYDDNNPTPLVIWHGMGDNYDSEGMQKTANIVQKVKPGTIVYSIRLDNDSSNDAQASLVGQVSNQVCFFWCYSRNVSSSLVSLC